MNGKRIGVLAAVVGLFTLGFGGIAQATDQTCTTETTGWVTESPGPNWTQVDERTVTDKEAYDEVIVVSEAVPAQHYSYVGGPIEGTPAPPSEDPEAWQANTTIEPHYQGAATPANKPDGSPYVDGDSGLHYTSHGSSGLADWFYFQAEQPEVTKTVHHDAVTHEEFKYEKTTCTDKPDQPNNPNNPDNPDNPDQPNNPDNGSPDVEPVLPHTGGTAPGLLAGVGTVLIGLGGLLYRRFGM